MLMNLDLDLNIDNYNISELENFLSLSGNYTFNDIYNNEKKNVEILISNNGYDNNVKSQIINFNIVDFLKKENIFYFLLGKNQKESKIFVFDDNQLSDSKNLIPLIFDYIS